METVRTKTTKMRLGEVAALREQDSTRACHERGGAAGSLMGKWNKIQGNWFNIGYWVWWFNRNWISTKKTVKDCILAEDRRGRRKEYQL